MSAAPALKLLPAPIVVEKVAETFGIPVLNLRGRTVSQALNAARQVGALLLADYTLLSQVEIGAAFGRVSSTAGRSLLIAGHARLGKNDERFAAALEQARQRVLQWSDHV